MKYGTNCAVMQVSYIGYYIGLPNRGGGFDSHHLLHALLSALARISFKCATDCSQLAE